jgi:Putative beta-barrel porin 2
VCSAVIVGVVPRAFAQDTAPTGAQENALSGAQENAPLGAEQKAPPGAQEIAPTGEYKEGLAAGGWMLFPSVFLGAVYNSNLAQAPQGTATENAFGGRVVPRLVSTYDGGIYKTMVYGVVDGDFYHDNVSNNNFFDTNTLSATAGFSQAYEATRELLFNVYGNYTRERDIFNSALNFNNGAIGPAGTPPNNLPIIINPFGTTPSVNPIPFNQFTGGAAATAKAGEGFATLAATAFYILYDESPDNVPTPFQTSLNGANIWVTGRIGYHILPGFYLFGEGDGIFQRFNNSLFDTNGYRAIGGMGWDDPKSLLRGEIYGGFQAQFQENLNNVVIPPGLGIPPTTNTSPVFGGRISYFPTPYWTFVAQADQSLGVSTFLSPSVPAGVPSLVTTAILQTTYGLAREWSVGVRGGYTRAQFFGIPDVQNGWLAGASFNYEIWRNLLLTLDYQYTNVRANVAFQSFMTNMASAGITYRY